MQTEIFLDEIVNIKLKNPMQKVLKMQPAFNHTYVILKILHAGKSEAIVHIGDDGSELF
jgi:hypothetical protein